MGNTAIMARRSILPVDKRNASVVPDKKHPTAGWETFLTGISRGKAVLEYGADDSIFMQGQPADSVLFLLRGKVKTSGYIVRREGSDCRYSRPR